MKFTKEQAFEILKGILTNNGKKTLRMSEKSMNKQLDTLIPLVGNDEMELAEFVEKVKSTFETMNGNVEKDFSDFVKSWEKEHPAANDLTKDAKDKESPVDDPMKEELKKALERLDILEKEREEAKKESSISQKRKELVEAMKKEGVKDSDWINSFLSEVAITEELDVEAKAKAYAKFYNKDNSRTPRNVTPGPIDAGSKENPFKDVAEFMKQRRETEAKLNVN